MVVIMSGIGSKLSRHVLGMKFMRKTKAQIDGSESKVTSSPLSASASTSKADSSHKAKNEPNVSSATSSNLVVEELWSYNQCERYVFGRQSFGGFNPVVEKNVRKGIWKPFYLEEGDVAVESSDEDEKKPQSDVDVSDEEMAKTYGSLIGTLAKRFNRRNEKGKRGNKKFKGKGKDQQKAKGNNWEKDDSKGKKYKSGDRHQNQKRQRDSTGSTHQSPSSKRNRGNYDESDMPPQKKRKFLKPSD